MIWLTWRQFRTQAIVTASVLAAIAIGLIVTGLDLRHEYAAAGLPGCSARHDCETVATALINQLRSGSDDVVIFFDSVFVLYAVPALIGLFWGAPLLAREFEAGTLRLAWNQSVSRNRWLAVKLGLIGLAAMATAGLLSLLITWWSSPIDRALNYAGANAAITFNRLDPILFGVRGIAPIGYAAFAVALGVTFGVLIRRTVPAMAATLTAFVVAELAWVKWVRPHLISPLVVKTALTSNFSELITGSQVGGPMTLTGDWHSASAWLLSNQTVTPAGHVFTGPTTSACEGNNFQACTAWVASKHLSQLVTFQPGSRFWAFQGIETAIFVLLAVALAVFCAWRIRARRFA
jgi:ABC-type transport system involved in multi-copper enzyme maturation permease subunit